MHIGPIFLFLICYLKFSSCRDFYMGMFKKNDLLVAHDIMNKERVPFRFSFGNYGRKFHCPITYVRVEDRLNVGRGPRVQVIRGGLRKKFVVLRLTSPYNHPISVNIYVGCANNKKFTNPPWTIIRPTKKPKHNTTEAPGNGTETDDNATGGTTLDGGDGGDGGEDASDAPAADGGDGTPADGEAAADGAPTEAAPDAPPPEEAPA